MKERMLRKLSQMMREGHDGKIFAELNEVRIIGFIEGILCCGLIRKVEAEFLILKIKDKLTYTDILLALNKLNSEDSEDAPN